MRWKCWCIYNQTLSVKELKTATIERLASFESQHGDDSVNLKRKKPKICRSTSENMHEYRQSNKLLTTLTTDDTHLGFEMLGAHKIESELHLRRRIVSTSEGKSTSEDVLRRSVSATDSHHAAEKMIKTDQEDQSKTKATLVEDEEVEKGSVCHC